MLIIWAFSWLWDSDLCYRGARCHSYALFHRFAAWLRCFLWVSLLLFSQESSSDKYKIYVWSHFIYFKAAESPYWLLSKNRPKDAQRALCWLRGKVSKEAVAQEFTELQNFSDLSNACIDCERQSIKCYHPRPTFLDKVKDLKRKRNLKPAVLIVCLVVSNEFSVASVWQPFIIQILVALGAPINPNYATIFIGGLGLAANAFLMMCIKNLGRRRLYLVSTTIVIACGVGLSEFFIPTCLITHWFSNAFQAFMDSFCYHQDGHRLNWILTNHHQISKTFETWLAITVTWRLLWYCSYNLAAKLVLLAFRIFI